MQCLARRMSNLKAADQFGGSRPSLCRQETFFHIVSLHPGVYKWVPMTYCNPEGEGRGWQYSHLPVVTCGPRVASISFGFSCLSKPQAIPLLSATSGRFSCPLAFVVSLGYLWEIRTHKFPSVVRYRYCYVTLLTRNCVINRVSALQMLTKL